MSDAVLMPVYNEAATVGDVIEAVRNYFAGQLLVVDDGSDDDTPRILAARDDLTIVHLDRNCGYGCALRVGFDVTKEMGVERLVTMDVDGQHEPAHIPQFLSALNGDADIISGSRYLPSSGGTGKAPADRLSINTTITAEINEVTGWGLTDAFCGFKAYRVAVLESLRLSECGYAMPLELWAKAWRRGLTVREIPVERIYCQQDRSFGQSLDDPERRLAYYRSVWKRALEEEL